MERNYSDFFGNLCGVAGLGLSCARGISMGVVVVVA